MGRNAVTMGNAYVVIGAKLASTFNQTLSSVKASLNSVGDSFMKTGAALGGIGTAISAPLIAVTDRMSKSIDDIAKAARRVGVSTEFMSAMGHAASLAGTDMAMFEKSIFTMSRAIEAANEGMITQKEAFDSIGVSVQDLLQMDPEQQFSTIAEAISKIDDASKRAYVSSALFGRGGRMLAPLVAGGAAGVSGARGEADRLGITIKASDANAAEEYRDVLTRLEGAFRGIALVVFREVVPYMQRFSLILTNAVTNAREYINLHREWIVYALELGRALVVVGGAMVAMGVAFKALAVVASPGGVFGVLAALVLYLSGALDGLIDKWSKVVLSFEVGGRTISGWLELIGQAWAASLPVFSAIGSGLVSIFDAVWISLVANGVKAFADIGHAIAKGFWTGVEKIALMVVDLLQKINDLSYGAYIIDDKRFMAQQESLKQWKDNIASFYSDQRKNADEFYDDTSRSYGYVQEASENAVNGVMEALKASRAGISEVFSQPLADAMESIFGKEGSPVKGLMDIFKGLNEEFSTNNMISAVEGGEMEMPAAAVAEATKIALQTAGTFSNRALGQFGDAGSTTEVLMTKQLDRLDQIAIATTQLAKSGMVASFGE